MRIDAIQSRVASSVIGVVCLLQMSPTMAAAPDKGQAITQGSRFPGFPAPLTDAGKNKHRRPVEITYTKWAHSNGDGTFGPLLEGFTGGDVPGTFVGEVLQRQVSRDLRIIRLEAVYEIQAGDQSFTALIRGGTGVTNRGEPASLSGAALLDGAILTGWRTGAQVHVAFQTTTNCPPETEAPVCFRGTITISPDSEG